MRIHSLTLTRSRLLIRCPIRAGCNLLRVVLGPVRAAHSLAGPGNRLRRSDCSALYAMIYVHIQPYDRHPFDLSPPTDHICLEQYFTGWPTAPVGQRYVYKVNGLASYVATLAVLAGCIYYGALDRSKMQLFMREFGAVLSVAQLWAYTVAITLYLKGALFKQGLPHGNLFVDFFHGYEPNPRFFGWAVSDLKWFLEGRALSGWGVVALLLAYQQYLLSGELTASMVLVVLFHQIYIFHYFFNETYVLGEYYKCIVYSLSSPLSSSLVA